MHLHVLPVDDLREHQNVVTVDEDCWCNPRWEFVDGGVVVVHNSADGREIKEIDWSEVWEQVTGANL